MQGFIWCFQLLFLSIILSLPEFFMEALHDGSSRILFIVQLFFKISLEVKIRQAILKNKHGAQHMFCFEELKYSSSCILKCNSFYLIFCGGVMSLLTISFMVHDSYCYQEWGILNPSISLLELSWVIFHLKPSIGNVAICGAYHWSKLTPYPSRWKRFFISSLISNKQLFFR